MKRIIFVITLVVMFSVGAFAQYGVRYSLSNLAGNNSIVRQWANNKYLLYTEESGSTEKFVLIEGTTQVPTAKAVSLKNMYKIRDFAVCNDSVFFIGVYKNRGFWGYFNINNLFTNGDTITYFLTNIISSSFGGPIGDDWQYSFVNFDELQTIPLPGRTELLLTGFRQYAIYENGIQMSTSSTPCLFHVKPPYTSFDYAYNASGSEKFDDIALNGNDIVVVGREDYTASDSANILFRYFSASNFDFTATPSKEQIRKNQTPSMSKVLIEDVGSISGNDFAITYYGNHNSNQGLFVELYSITLSNSSAYLYHNYYTFLPQGNPLATGCTLKKSTFNSIANTFCVLQDMMAPSLNVLSSVICRFEFANYPNSVACTTSHRTEYGTSVNSLANSVYGGYDYILSSGKWSSQSMFIRENASFQSSCLFHEALPLTSDNNLDTPSSTLMTLTKGTYTATRTPFYSTPSTTSCSLQCAH